MPWSGIGGLRYSERARDRGGEIPTSIRGEARSPRGGWPRILDPMIRVAVLDRQPAVRAGLEATLRTHAGYESVGSAGDVRSALALLYRSDPDVLVLDDLALARRMKVESPRTRVVLYAANPSPELILAAHVAGVD